LENGASAIPSKQRIGGVLAVTLARLLYRRFL
jgi:hypothetical protein